ncbi:MAG TPA: amidohydrolase family protein [Acidobacteriota bacterium]|nr:amidohydrolase family protein [Acidobacteriota bacterium]
MPRCFVRLSAGLGMILSAALLCGACTEHAALPIADGDLAFTHVSILPMDGRSQLLDQTVVVAGGRIVEIAPTTAMVVAPTTTVIDGTGKYLMPGVAEMHGHYPQDAESQFTRDIMFLYVANGVTLVRGMQGGPQHLPLRESLARGDLIGPRILVSAPMLHGQNVTDAEQAITLVRSASETGFDHLKVHEGLSPEVYDAIADTANEIGISFSGHVTNHVGLYHALAKGQLTIDHLDNYLEALVDDQQAVADLGLFDLGQLASRINDTRIAEAVAATVEAGAGVVPTMALWEVLFGARNGEEWLKIRPEIGYMPPDVVAGWVEGTNQRVEQLGEGREAVSNILALRRRVLKALHDAAVPVLLGTDSPQIFSVPGFSIHHEMALMVESGLTPYDVLFAGTQAVAQFYGATDDYGSVAVGRRADLVLLNTDPTADVGNFSDRFGVVVNGRWIDEEEIQTELAAIAARVATDAE